MKRKLGVLTATLAVPALILALILGQPTTGVTDLSISEMAATTGTGVCDTVPTPLQQGDDPSDGGCDTGFCLSPSNPCGTDYTHYNSSTICQDSGAPSNECRTEVLSGYWRIEHDCRCDAFSCMDSVYPWGTRYKIQSTTSSC